MYPTETTTRITFDITNHVYNIYVTWQLGESSYLNLKNFTRRNTKFALQEKARRVWFLKQWSVN